MEIGRSHRDGGATPRQRPSEERPALPPVYTSPLAGRSVKDLLSNFEQPHSNLHLEKPAARSASKAQLSAASTAIMASNSGAQPDAALPTTATLPRPVSPSRPVDDDAASVRVAVAQDVVQTAVTDAIHDAEIGAVVAAEERIVASLSREVAAEAAAAAMAAVAGAAVREAAAAQEAAAVEREDAQRRRAPPPPPMAAGGGGLCGALRCCMPKHVL